MYRSINDLPFVCRLNLPEPAQKVYRDAFNQAWQRTDEPRERYRAAQHHAWTEVRNRFMRDHETGRWIPRNGSWSRTSNGAGRR